MLLTTTVHCSWDGVGNAQLTLPIVSPDGLALKPMSGGDAGPVMPLVVAVQVDDIPLASGVGQLTDVVVAGRLLTTTVVLAELDSSVESPE